MKLMTACTPMPLVLALLVVASPVAAQDSITTHTRWMLRTKSNVRVGSPIVRLGDIVEPTDPNMAAWKRLARAPIGLVPVGGQAMVIDRGRLNSIILAADATPRAIDWVGEEKIRVIYDASVKSVPVQPIASQVEQVAYAETKRDANQPQYRRLTAAELKRVVHWIELAIQRFQPDVATNYEVEVDPNQPGLASLRLIGGVTDCSPVSELHEGVCTFAIEARSADGLVRSEVSVRMTAHPKVIVPVRTLGRGHRIEPGDLELSPLPAERLSGDVVVDMDSIVGKEVRQTLRVGNPIGHDEVGDPILIHRGDLIEIRVLGGGVRVTTNAKAVGSGSRGDLIEVETLEPRKRMVARVAQIGVAEIVTRAPVVR